MSSLVNRSVWPVADTVEHTIYPAKPVWTKASLHLYTLAAHQNTSAAALLTQPSPRRHTAAHGAGISECSRPRPEAAKTLMLRRWPPDKAQFERLASDKATAVAQTLGRTWLQDW
jgi:hypothetical protein